MSHKAILRILLGLEWLFVTVIVIFIVKNCSIVDSKIVIAMSDSTKVLFLAAVGALFASGVARTICRYKFGIVKYNSAVISTCVIVGVAVLVFIYLIMNLY